MDYIPLLTPLSKIIKENPHHGKFGHEVLINIIPEIDLKNSIEDLKQRLKIKLKTGLCSYILIEQLARHNLKKYEKFGSEIHQYHVPTILDTIECVENGAEMNIRPFKKSILHGLKHLHHNSCTFIVKNLENYWKEKCIIRFNKKKIKENDEIEFQNELLNEIYKQLLIEHTKEKAQEKAHFILLNNLQNECVFRKMKEQTGEWIIFAQKDRINYYLCLATHEESKNNNDQVIIDRLKPCLTEFPELKNIFL